MRKVLIFLLTFFSGCAPYVMVGGKYTAGPENFEVDLPQSWRKHELTFDHHPISRAMLDELKKRHDPTGDVVRITRDGLLLQHIVIGRIEINKEWPHTKRKLSKGMLPQEVAEVIIDNIRSNPNISKQHVLENSPAKLGGFPAFKLIYTYQTKESVGIKGACYGAMMGDWYYYLLYEAPERHYFAKDYPIFEKLKDSFRLLKSDFA